jgi:hypothetical protein
MKVPAFWSLGTLLAVIFIGKSWVRLHVCIPYLNIITDRLKRGAFSGGSLCLLSV